MSKIRTFVAVLNFPILCVCEKNCTKNIHTNDPDTILFMMYHDNGTTLYNETDRILRESSTIHTKRWK